LYGCGPVPVDQLGWHKSGARAAGDSRLAWRLEELGPDIEDPDGFLSDREYYERGYRWCESYSTWEPAGECGYVAVVNLVPLQPWEYDVARQALRKSPGTFVRAALTLFGPAIRRVD
jgi:hypothetical protein